jgi:hypothetical protein
VPIITNPHNTHTWASGGIGLWVVLGVLGVLGIWGLRFVDWEFEDCAVRILVFELSSFFGEGRKGEGRRAGMKQGRMDSHIL